jgi:hypothetical protein
VLGKIFNKVTAQGCGSELLKLVSFVLSIPISNATCERQFSVMNQSFSKEWRKMTVDLLKAELHICQHYTMTCSGFYEYVLKNQKLLNCARSGVKYKFNKNN